jgi:hypothetical protein
MLAFPCKHFFSFQPHNEVAPNRTSCLSMNAFNASQGTNNAMHVHAPSMNDDERGRHWKMETVNKCRSSSN